MRRQRFVWAGAEPTAIALRNFAAEAGGRVSTAAVSDMGTEIFNEGDAALLRLVERHDGIQLESGQLRVAPQEVKAALRSLDPGLREALELAAVNIRAVAEAQPPAAPVSVTLPQGQTVTMREVPVKAAGVYAPGGRAVYPSTVLMCAIPAQVAGVERIALVSPPGREGRPSTSVLAAAALCGIDEVYAVGGAQAIFALAFGTETIPRVNVVVGPGNSWVQEAKRRAFGEVGIDSYAGPSELMVVAGHDCDPEWIALDLCAQAEHGADSPLVVVAVEERVLDAVEEHVVRLAGSRGSVTEAPLALVAVPDAEAAVELANAYAPEHLEIAEGDGNLLAERVQTAGCVFVGRYGATAFGDYVAGSNHVLPTTRAGAYAGPLGPGTFRRRISTVEISAEAAAKLAPYADTIARAEGLPVHGESAMIRAKDD